MDTVYGFFAIILGPNRLWRVCLCPGMGGKPGETHDRIVFWASLMPLWLPQGMAREERASFSLIFPARGQYSKLVHFYSLQKAQGRN
jgi:hypothetical protein